MKKLLLILLTFPAIAHAQTDIWVEQFNYTNGTTAVTTGPTQWYTDVRGANFINANDYFEVRNNRLEARDVNGFVMWLSEDIDISNPAYDNVIISFDLSEAGRHEPDDYVRAYYSIDGADSVLFAEHTDDLPGGGPITLAVGGLSGNTVRITISIANNGGNERFRIDNVGVRQVGDLVSFASGNWDDGNNWSADGGSSACSCSPSAFTNATIDAVHTIDVNGTYGVNDLTVEGTLQWVTGGDEMTVLGDLSIPTGGAVDRNLQTAAVMAINGGSTVTVNDATVGLDLEDLISFGSGGTTTFTGSGRIALNDDFIYEGGNHTVVNNLTGTFQMDQLRFRPNFSNNTFINNQSMTIASDLRFNHDDCTFENNGTLTIIDDIVVAGNGDINNSFDNNLGATTNLNQVRMGNAPGFTMTNQGTLNMTDDFLNVPASNSVTNETLGTWNFGGNNSDVDLQLFTAAANSQFTYNRAGNQDILTVQDNYFNLSLTGTGTKSTTGALDVNGNLNVSSVLDAGTDNMLLAGNLSNTGTLTLNNNFTFDGANQTVNPGTSAFQDLTISGTNTKTLATDVTINGNLTINATLDVSVSDYDLQVAGNLTNNGTFLQQTGTVILNGSGAQTISGTLSFYDLDISKSGGSVSNDGNISIASELDITTATTLDADGAGSGTLTILSDVTGDARIAPITGGGTITGNLTVQRYLPNTSAQRAWRYVGSSVTGAFVSDWKNEVPITGTFNDPSTQAEWPGIPGIVSSSPSMYRYNEAAVGNLNARWETYPLDGTSSTGAVLEPGRGYTLYVRSSGTETLDVTGTATTGQVDVAVTSSGATADDGWNLVSNPYPSAIDWDNVTIPSGVNDEIHILDNVNNGGTGAGNYIRYVGGVGTPPSYTGEIAMGQAFWVRATSNATIQFQEDDKVSGTPVFFKTAPLTDLLRVKLNGPSGYDEMVVRFDLEATDNFDKQFDAGQRNIYFNSISTSIGRELAAINTLHSEFCEKNVPVTILGTSPGVYALELYNLQSFDEISVKLRDKLTGSTTLIDVDQTIAFEITADSTSFFDRFELTFDRQLVSNIAIQAPELVCENDPVRLTVSQATPGRTYALIAEGAILEEQVAGHDTLSFDLTAYLEAQTTFAVRTTTSSCEKVVDTEPVTVVKEQVPAAPTFGVASICREGQTEIHLDGSASAFLWYTSAEAPEPFLTTSSRRFVTDVLTASTTYYVAPMNESGCVGERVAIPIEVIQPAIPSISMEGDSLISSTPLGNQWFLNGLELHDETGSAINLQQEGEYVVRHSEQGCATHSEPYAWVVADLSDLSGDIRITPNPVQQYLNVQLFGDVAGGKRIAIIDTGGRVLIDRDLESERLALDVNNFKSGIYIIRITTDSGSYRQRFIKK